MKTLLVCHYFAPEIGAPQARLSEVARRWAATGDDVQVLTGFPNHPTGIVHDGYRGRRSMTEEMDGYEVTRTWVYATPNDGFVKKTLGHLSFMVSGLLLGWRRLQRPDVVVVSSPTFFSILTAWILAKRFRVPWVLEVRDLWPGIFVELGVIRNRWVIKALERLELAAYASANRVVVVTDGFKNDLVRRGVPAGKIEVITNGVDLERFTPGPADPSVRHRLGAAGDQALVVYIGAHGISHGLDSVIEAARMERDTRFAFVGEGARKEALIESAADLDNVVFLPGVPRDEVPGVLRAADVLLVPLRDIPLFETFIPSKMFEFLATGTAVVGAVRGEPAGILKRAGALVVAPEEPESLAAAINELVNDPDRRAEREALGRRFVAENYDRNELADRYQQVLADAVTPDLSRRASTLKP